MTRPARNGVDGPNVFAVIEGVKGQPGMAQFQFRAGNKWIDGTHDRSAIQGFRGSGQQDVSRTELFTFDVAHQAMLIGDSNGPAAVGSPLRASAGCLNSGPANVAAARGVTLHWVFATVRGDIGLLGSLGLSDTVCNGSGRSGSASRSRAMPPGGTRRTGRAVPAAVGRLCRVGQRRRRRRRRHHAIGGLNRPPLSDCSTGPRRIRERQGSTPDPTTKGSTPGPDHDRGQLVDELSGPVYDGSLLVGRDNRKLELGEIVRRSGRRRSILVGRSSYVIAASSVAASDSWVVSFRSSWRAPASVMPGWSPSWVDHGSERRVHPPRD